MQKMVSFIALVSLFFQTTQPVIKRGESSAYTASQGVRRSDRLAGKASRAEVVLPDRQCRHCLRIFDYPARLKEHLPVHTGEKPFTCNKCGRLYCRLNALVKHQVKNTHGCGCH